MARINSFRTADSDYLDLRNEDTINWISTHYPAITARDRSSNLSDDYQFLSTINVARTLQDRFGLQLVYVSQQHSSRRNPAHQEHVLRFQFPDSGPVQLKNVGDSHPELVLSNSHNGRSAIRFYAGIFRLVCSNGMVVADSYFGRFKVRHFGSDAIGRFNTLMDDSARRMSILDARIKKMQSLVLHPHDQNALANIMIEARKAPKWVGPKDVLIARRAEDEGTVDGHRSLWKTFNVLQENLTNREIDFRPEGQRPGFIRPITGSMRDLVTNEALWLRLEEFISERFPEAFGETIEGEQGGGYLPPAEPEEATEAEPGVRSFDQLMKLSYAEMANISEEESAALSKDERKKLSSRKSYLKGKEKVEA